jgi:hypothetical protein
MIEKEKKKEMGQLNLGGLLLREAVQFAVALLAYTSRSLGGIFCDLFVTIEHLKATPLSTPLPFHLLARVSYDIN